jgi:hypothetical protein
MIDQRSFGAKNSRWQSNARAMPPNTVCSGFVGILRVFKQVFYSQANSVKAALPRPTHQRVPHEEHTGQAASRWAAEEISNKDRS